MILQTADRPHSSISPSSFQRISACTASYQLTASSRRAGQLRVAGAAATEGSAAHALLEHALRYDVELDGIEAVHVNGASVPVTDRMREAVQTAITWVRENLAGRELLLEERVTLPWGRVAGWVDIAAGPPWLVADFKYGHGVVPASSAQLGLYALGLLLQHERSVEGVGEATTVVLQPRASAESVRSHVWTYAALRSLRDELITTLDRIRRSDFSYGAGPWCRWCPCAALCPELAAVARDSIAVDIGAAPELVAAGEAGAERLNEALLRADALEHHVRQTWAVAAEYLTAGGKLADFKLVAKPRGGLTVVPRSDRRPEVDVGRALKAALRSSVAFEYRNAALSSAQSKGQ